MENIEQWNWLIKRKYNTYLLFILGTMVFTVPISLNFILNGFQTPFLGLQFILLFIGIAPVYFVIKTIQLEKLRKNG